MPGLRRYLGELRGFSQPPRRNRSHRFVARRRRTAKTRPPASSIDLRAGRAKGTHTGEQPSDPLIIRL
jgi:hypothetical protein